MPQYEIVEETYFNGRVRYFARADGEYVIGSSSDSAESCEDLIRGLCPRTTKVVKMFDLPIITNRP